MAKRKRERGNSHQFKWHKTLEGEGQSLSRFPVSAWPDREGWRQKWIENTKEKGPGCFLSDLTEVKEGDQAVIVVPIWLTIADMTDTDKQLRFNTVEAIRHAEDNKMVVGVNIDKGMWQVVGIPWDETMESEVLFEAWSE